MNLSLFLVSRLRSIPSMRESNQVIMLPRLSACCDPMIWSRNPYTQQFSFVLYLILIVHTTLKYSSLRRIRPSRGRDIDHWFRQSSNMIILSTCTNYLRIQEKFTILTISAFLSLSCFSPFAASAAVFLAAS